MSNASQLSCENCGVDHGPDDIFCENCGYDFITGSLPSGDESVTPPLLAEVPSPAETGETPATAPAEVISGSPPLPDSPPLSIVPDSPGESPTSGDAPAPAAAKLRFSISVDRAYFDAVVSEGELAFPDPVPETTEIETSGAEFHIGRTSHSRAIHPDLDIAELTGDPAVSSRHAVIRISADGSISVTDVGSTNGTFVGAVDGKAITVGELVEVQDTTPVYVGAWTRLEVTSIETAP